jgi:uncharacterized protein YkwD
LVILNVWLVSMAILFACPHEGKTQPLPLYAPPATRVQLHPSAHEEKKAQDLFGLAHKENPRLTWDECLAGKAFRRAKHMVDNNILSHRDPRTGKNPVWETVVQCRSFRYAGENLAKGYESADVIHRALMQSPTHRHNLVDPKYRFVGVGCYNDVCVELFAGF